MRESNRRLDDYLDDHTSDHSLLLQRIYRETHLKTMAPQMLSGKRVGQLLRFISLWIRPRHVLEIGTFTGFGTLCLLEGLQPDGQLHTFEVNAEMHALASRYFDHSPRRSQITHHLGDARHILPIPDILWDLVFIDASKKEYPNYYDQVIDHIRSGGVLVIDNVLWDQKVLGDDNSIESRSLRMLNEKIAADDRVENVMLEVRDGITICRRK